MSEPVGGKSRWTLPLDPPYRAARRLLFVSELGNPCGSAFSCENRGEPDLGFRCGSASPVCYLISVLGAARRWNGMFVGCAGSGFRCGSAFPVCYLISVLGAARRFLFVT